MSCHRVFVHIVHHLPVRFQRIPMDQMTVDITFIQERHCEYSLLFNQNTSKLYQNIGSFLYIYQHLALNLLMSLV